MKKANLALAIIFGMVLFSCGEKSTENTQEETEMHEGHDHADHEGHDHEADATATAEKATENTEVAEAIEMNNGAKWLVNNEMKPFVSKSESLVKKYIDSKSTDYKDLAKQLKDENTKLVKSCTMEGKSHEELHKWLHPHMELLDKLAVEESPENATKLVTELKTSFDTYHKYFN